MSLSLVAVAFLVILSLGQRYRTAMIWIQDVFLPLSAGRIREFFPFLFSSCRGVHLCPKANRIFCLQRVMSPMPQERERRRICVDNFPQWLLFPFNKTEPRGRLSLVFHSSFSHQYPMKMVEESLRLGINFYCVRSSQRFYVHASSYLDFSNLLKVLAKLFIMA